MIYIIFLLCTLHILIAFHLYTRKRLCTMQFSRYVKVNILYSYIGQTVYRRHHHHSSNFRSTLRLLVNSSTFLALKSPSAQRETQSQPHIHYIIIYSGTSLIRTPLGQKKVSGLGRCPYFRGSKPHKNGIRAGKRVLYIEVVLISGSPD